MRVLDIRSRMLLAALLPVTLIAILLAGVFLTVQFDDLGKAHNQQARRLARQLATASEYGLFSANIEHLQVITSGALREPEVSAIAIVNIKGQVLARAGRSSFDVPVNLPQQESMTINARQHIDLLLQPIFENPINLDDLFEIQTTTVPEKPHLLGHVLIEFSRQALRQREREILLLGFAITLGCLLFGWGLAVHLGRGVIRPILRISRMIERIGQGDLSARAKIPLYDPLRDLQRGLNQMAERLQVGRDELEQRINLATLALREKKEEAETATRAKSQFLAAASHDLRQPTHALGMFVARLAQLPHDAETQHLIANLQASVQAMKNLLDGLLDISRLEAGAVQVQLSAFAVTDIFSKLQQGLTISAVEKGLLLRIRPTTVWVQSDPELLHRILFNLVVNALNYTRHGSVLVACRLMADGQHVRLEVWDSGIGIAPEHHQSIFKEFYQVANTARDRNKGMGLGLNIVQRKAALLGHDLHMRSCLGRGTRFSIVVPLAAVGISDSPQQPTLKAFDDLAALRVLVIEDDALAREGLVSLLVSWGYMVHRAEGLSDALGLFKQGLWPDVIVSDYRLRDGANGIAAIRHLRQVAERSIPACLMSGDTDPSLMQEAQQEGLTLLHKPVRPAKLRNLIRRLTTDTPPQNETV